MTEILNGKNAKITALTLPADPANELTLVVLNNDANDYLYVDSFSVSTGIEIGEHELVGSDMKIFSDGVKNAVVNLTVRMTTLYNNVELYKILEGIKTWPINSDGAMAADSDQYWIEITLYNKAGSAVAVLEPAATAWAACEVGDLDFPSNDIISIPITLRYGELIWAGS